MAVFQQITLTWNGRECIIPADRVMGAVCEIEEVVTLPELFDMGRSGQAKISKLARAYGALLRYAGTAVDDETVYQGMFATGEAAQRTAEAIRVLIGIMMPPEISGAASEGNLARAKKARSRLSKRGSRRPSAAAG